MSEENSHKITSQEEGSELDRETHSLTKENLSKLNQSPLKEGVFLPLTAGNLSRHNQKEPSQNVPIRNISASSVSSGKSKVNEDGYCEKPSSSFYGNYIKPMFDFFKKDKARIDGDSR